MTEATSTLTRAASLYVIEDIIMYTGNNGPPVS